MTLTGVLLFVAGAVSAWLARLIVETKRQADEASALSKRWQENHERASGRNQFTGVNWKWPVEK